LTAPDSVVAREEAARHRCVLLERRRKGSAVATGPWWQLCSPEEEAPDAVGGRPSSASAVGSGKLDREAALGSRVTATNLAV
jgi:hypothetical protein